MSIEALDPPRRMTDSDHADAIRSAVQDLNNLFAAAAADGIEVAIDFHTFQTIGALPSPLIEATLKRRIT